MADRFVLVYSYIFNGQFAWFVREQSHVSKERVAQTTAHDKKKSSMLLNVNEI